MPTSPEIVDSLRENPDPTRRCSFTYRKMVLISPKPHKPDFAFYFPNESAAKAAEWKLNERGFEVTVEPPDENHEQYLVVAVTTMVPTLSAINALFDEFENLADELGGDYDGWGAEAVD